MSDVLNIAVQCNSPEQLIALIAIMIFVFAPNSRCTQRHYQIYRDGSQHHFALS